MDNFSSLMYLLLLKIFQHVQKKLNNSVITALNTCAILAKLMNHTNF